MSDIFCVLIADIHPIFRAGLKYELATSNNLFEVAEADTFGLVESHCRNDHLGLLILSLDLIPNPAMEKIANLRRSSPTCKVLLLIDNEGGGICVQSIIGTGIDGFVLKNEPIKSILAAIQAINDGGCYFSQAAMRKMRHKNNQALMLETFTNRERQVFDLMSKGCNNRQIAIDLDLSYQTIRNLVSRIYRKVGVCSRPEFMVWHTQN